MWLINGILVLIQSVTELLPISSSLHLWLASWALGIPWDPAVHVALHAGTGLAWLMWFWRDFWSMGWAICRFYDPWIRKTPAFHQARFVMCATLPSVLAGLCIASCVENLKQPFILAGSSIAGGLYLLFSDQTQPSREPQYTLKEALILGLAQVFAFFPGMSRLGLVWATGRLLGWSRVESLRWSLLLGVPLMLAGTSYSFLKTWKQQGTLLETSGLMILIATLGFELCLMGLWPFLSRGIRGFGLYRILLGVVLFGLC